MGTGNSKIFFSDSPSAVGISLPFEDVSGEVGIKAQTVLLCFSCNWAVLPSVRYHQGQRLQQQPQGEGEGARAESSGKASGDKTGEVGPVREGRVMFCPWEQSGKREKGKEGQEKSQWEFGMEVVFPSRNLETQVIFIHRKSHHPSTP